ncbi:GntR family transcriptional regulator [Sciscionella sediminilitoris]|uniref:GntR family transcriptional regulator n=1 Tax=Sciscionella sediminilitoris TaxID=1445613 RepID=UPI00055BD8A9|nr:GntR family transcriptional regulator [Sciscionella sp. SE31]
MVRSRYGQIADTLAAELGELEPGTKVASEHSIATRFGVSRAAARAAVQELEGRLLVRRVRGAGTFVNRRIDYVISQRKAPSWHRTVREAGARPRSVVREVSPCELPAEQASLLERSEFARAHRLVRQYYVDGLLTSVSKEWIPADVVADIDLAVHAEESVDTILRQMGRVCPVRAWCRVSYSIPDAETVRALETEPHRPVWLVESMSRDTASGRPVMCSTTWSLPESSRIVVELETSPENLEEREETHES